LVNRDDNPVQWALFMDELEEAREHLGRLIADITTDRNYDEDRLRIDMGHLAAHLNRGWGRRNCTRDLTDEERESWREYPQDLRPIA